MTRILNILHFSDFHQNTATELSESHVLRALWGDLEIIADSENAPDICVFSGDLVYSADESGREGYNRFRISVLDEISHFTGLSPKKIIITPGNHDASRAAIEENSDFLIELRRSGFGKNQERERDYCIRAFEGYLEFAADYYSRPELLSEPFLHEFDFPEFNLRVGAINTAALSSAATRSIGSDFELLRVRDSDVATVALTAGPSRRILVQHHPIEWLHPESRTAYEPATRKKIQALLYGHMHNVSPKSSYDDGRRLTSNQSGALFYGSHRSDTYKGYSLISLDCETGQSKIVHRKYYNNRASFDASLDDFSGGVFYSDERSQRHFRFHQPKYSMRELRNWGQNALLRHYVDPWALTAGIQPQDRFFEPEVELRDPIAEAKAKEEDIAKSEVLGLFSLLNRPEKILLEGAAESGKSESLRQWTVRGLDGSEIRPCLPVYVDWKNVNLRNHSFESAVRRSVPALPEGFEVVDLLRRGVLEVLIDDFPLNAEALKWIDDGLRAFPKVRIILASKESLRNPLDFGTIRSGGEPFVRARLRQLRPAQIRKYVKSALPLDASGEDRFLSEIHREVTQNNLPLTPFTIWSIIEVYQRDKSIRFANKANFVERLIEIKLEKFALSEIDASTFDFENKSHCLTELAAWMVVHDQYRPAVAHVEAWMASYVETLGLPIRPLRLLKMFEDSSVLVRQGDQLSFAFRIFLEYFIACKMAQDKNFRAEIVNEKNLLSFHNEVVLYFAKSRQDRDLIDTVGNLLDAMAAEMERQGKLDPGYARSLDEMPVVGGRMEKEEFEHFASHMSLPQPSEEERDAVFAGEFPEDIGRRQEVFRPKLENEESRWIFSMILYSQIIRFADFLTDQEKQTHVARALRHWSRFAHVALKLVPALIETGTMVVDGVNYDIQGLLDLPRAERLRVLQTLLPFGISRLVSYYMNSDKLRRQIRTVDNADSAFAIMLRGGLLLDLGYEGIADDLERFLAMTDAAKWSRGILLRRAVEAYSRSRLPDGDILKFRKVVSDGIARHRGAGRRQLAERASQISAAMYRKRLQIQIARDDGAPTSSLSGSSQREGRGAAKNRRRRHK